MPLGHEGSHFGKLQSVNQKLSNPPPPFLSFYASLSYLLLICEHGVSPQIHKELAEAEQLIKRQAAQLECSLLGVIHEQFLERYISEEHWDSLCVQPVSHTVS